MAAKLLALNINKSLKILFKFLNARIAEKFTNFTIYLIKLT